MAVPGLEYPMNDTVKINIAKVFDVAFEDMKKEAEYTTERLFEIFKLHLKKAVEVTAAGINLHLDHQWEVTPELVMNLMMYNTLEKGEDISQCAHLFSIGVDGAGLAVVADSFAALQQRIEDEKIIGWHDIIAALENNYQGTDGERIRRLMNSSHRYCEVNSIGD